MQPIAYNKDKKMELVGEMMKEVEKETKALMLHLWKRYCIITNEINKIDAGYKKAQRKIIIEAVTEEIQHQLGMQLVKQLHQLPVGSQVNLSKLQIFDEQMQEQIEQGIIHDFQHLLSQVTGNNVMADLKEVIKKKMACSLSKLDEQLSLQLTEELKKRIKLQEQKRSQQIISTEQKLKMLQSRRLNDQKRQYCLDIQRQISHQYFEREELSIYAVLIKNEAHKICQQPVQTTYSFVPIIIKRALSMEQQAQKPKRDEYYLKIACYMAMLSKDTTKPVSDFMYHACKNYV